MGRTAGSAVFPDRLDVLRSETGRTSTVALAATVWWVSIPTALVLPSRPMAELRSTPGVREWSCGVGDLLVRWRAVA